MASQTVTPLSLSPAGGILLSLKAITSPAVEARFADDSLTAPHREVFEEILREWSNWGEMRRMEAE